LIYQCF